MPVLKFSNYLRLFIFLFALGAGLLALGYLPQQNDFTEIILYYTLAFGGYIGILLYGKEDLSITHWIIVAIALRIGLLFSFPNLSDDIYRFIWDGNIIHNHQNPYSLLPTEVKGIPGNTPELLGLLNSPAYYSVYPPVSQLIYWFASFGNISYGTSALIIKICLLLAEIGSFILLLRILKLAHLKAHRFLIYALNPLIIIEVIGNVHFEGMMLFFLLASIYAVICNKNSASALLLALGAATKLFPLMFFPFVWKFANHNKKLFLVFGISCIVLFLPVLLGVEIANFAESVDLYFGKFEFNGGIYYVLRYLGELLSGYNLIRYIGPLMALTTVGLMFKLWKSQKSGNIQQLLVFSFFSITCYYLLSTTVHPWYLCLPLALSLFTRYRFVVLWTGLIMLSYIHYSYDPYRENMWIAFIEYSLVIGFFFYELKTKR